MTAADHAAVSAAELAAFDGTDLEDVIGFEAARAAIDRVVAGEWWPGPAVVTVRRSRTDARSSVTRCSPAGEDVEIRLADPQATLATAAHELAHVLAGVAQQHGPMFRRALLDVVEAMTNPPVRSPGRGRLHVGQLAEAFAASGLDVGARRWPAPDPAVHGGAAGRSDGDAIAL